MHGLVHPEGGHVCVPRRARDAAFEGSDPRGCFGGLCAEGMSCSVSLAKRSSLGGPSGLASLPDDDPTWDAAAHYIGALCANIVLLVSPERIVLSGCVMRRAALFPRVRARMQAMLGGVVAHEALTTADGVARYVSPSTWGDDSGLVGALTLAAHAYDGSRRQLMQARGARPRWARRIAASLLLAGAVAWPAAAVARGWSPLAAGARAAPRRGNGGARAATAGMRLRVDVH